MPVLVDIEAKTIETIARRFKKHRGPLDADTRLREDLGADSLDMIELLFELEQATGVTIEERAAADIQTVGDAVRTVEKAIA